MIVTYESECVFADLSTQHPTRMRRVVVYGLSGATAVFTLPHKQHDFRKKTQLMYILCVF
jgi:hypothetical protein